METQATRSRGRTTTRQKIRLGILFFMVMAFPILMNYFSAFLIIEGSSQGTMVFSFFFWTAWVLTSLLFGRAACGWLCPLGAVQETKDRMTPRDLSRIRHLKWIKYVLAGGWVGAIVFFAVAAGGYHAVNLLYMTESGVSVSSPQSWFTWGTIMTVILLPAFLIGRRGFCQYFCPWGVLNTISTKVSNLLHLPSLHLEAVEGKCKNCRTCLANCPMSLPVAEMAQKGSMKNDECILCGTCIDNCPNRAIKYSWAAPQHEVTRTKVTQQLGTVERAN